MAIICTICKGSGVEELFDGADSYGAQCKCQEDPRFLLNQIDHLLEENAHLSFVLAQQCQCKKKKRLKNDLC